MILGISAGDHFLPEYRIRSPPAFLPGNVTGTRFHVPDMPACQFDQS